MLQPGIGSLELATIRSNQLLEDTVLVPEGVSPDRQLLGGGGIQVTRGQTAETTVSECCVAFLINEVLGVKPELIDTFAILVSQAEVEEDVVEGTTHEVLNVEIVRVFWLFASVGKLSIVPVQLCKE